MYWELGTPHDEKNVRISRVWDSFHNCTDWPSSQVWSQYGASTHTHTDTTSDSVRLCFTENRQRYQRNRIAQYTPLLWLANLLKPLSILKRPSSFTRGSAKLRIQGSNCHNNTQHCSPLQTQTQPSKDSICEWGRWLSTMQQAGSHSVGKQPCLSQWAGESWNVIIHLIPTNKLN